MSNPVPPPHIVKLDPAGTCDVQYSPTDTRTMLIKDAKAMGLMPKVLRYLGPSQHNNGETFLAFEVAPYPGARGDILVSKSFAEEHGWLRPQTIKDMLVSDQEYKQMIQGSWPDSSSWDGADESAKKIKAAHARGHEEGYELAQKRAKEEFIQQVKLMSNKPIVANMSHLGVEAFDSKAGSQLAEALTKMGVSGAALGNYSPTGAKPVTIKETKEAPMDRALSKERLIENIREAILTHKPNQVLEDLLKESEEAAFEAGHDVGYEEGLEDQQLEDEDQEVQEEVKVELLARTLDEGSEAGTRLAVRQLVKLIKEPLVSRLSGHLGDNDPSTRAKVSSFLETELGEALLMSLLAMGLGFLPGALGQDQLTALTKELRVSAMTNVGDTVADLLMGPLRQVLSNMVVPSKPAQALPVETSQVKVNIPVTVSEPAFQSR